MSQFVLLILSIASLHLIIIVKVDYNQMAILILLILLAQLLKNMLVFCLFKERHTASLLTSHLRTEIVTIDINARL